jgi:hypothetical protein
MIQFPVTTIRPINTAKSGPTRKMVEYEDSFDLIVLIAGLANRFVEDIQSVSFKWFRSYQAFLGAEKVSP